MDSLFGALSPLKDSIFFRIDDEEIAMDNKILTAILLTTDYNHFLLAVCHQIAFAIKNKEKSLFLLKLRIWSGTYLC